MFSSADTFQFCDIDFSDFRLFRDGTYAQTMSMITCFPSQDDSLYGQSMFFSQRKNYLLVGTADGILTVYEDSVLKVKVRPGPPVGRPHCDTFLWRYCCKHVLTLPVVLLAAGGRAAGKSSDRGPRQYARHVSEPVGAFAGQQVCVGRLRDQDPVLHRRLQRLQEHRHETQPHRPVSPRRAERG